KYVMVLSTLAIALLVGSEPRRASAKAGLPSELRVVALSDGWIIRPNTFVLNNLGSVVYGAGESAYTHTLDRLALVTRDGSVRFAAVGDPAPGFDGEFFIGFGQFVLTDQDDVIFAADFRAPWSIWDFLGNRTPNHGALFRYSAGKIGRIVAAGDAA